MDYEKIIFQSSWSCNCRVIFAISRSDEGSLIVLIVFTQCCNILQSILAFTAVICESSFYFKSLCTSHEVTNSTLRWWNIGFFVICIGRSISSLFRSTAIEYILLVEDSNCEDGILAKMLHFTTIIFVHWFEFLRKFFLTR